MEGVGREDIRINEGIGIYLGGGWGGENKPKHPKSLTLCLYGGKWMEGEEEGKRGERKRW